MIDPLDDYINEESESINPTQKYEIDAAFKLTETYRQIEIEAEATKARARAHFEALQRGSALRQVGWEQPLLEDVPKCVKLAAEYFRKHGHLPLTASDCAFLWACGVKVEEDIRQ